MTTNDDLRNYMEIACLLHESAGDLTDDDFLVDDIELPPENSELKQALLDLKFKLESYQDPDGGEDSGVERGMSMAADMLQTIIDRM